MLLRSETPRLETFRAGMLVQDAFVHRGGLPVFFFSSRRRHTRYWRDWSSDVCSSDLGTAGEALLTALELDAHDADARYHLAVLHVLVGALDEARSALLDLVSGGSGAAE